jgi:hypothetical protein
MFEFVHCRPDPRFDQSCWYVVVRSGDQEVFEAVHRGVCHMLYKKFDEDPHWGKDPFNRGIMNVSFLGGKWLEGIEILFFRYGAALVGLRGGMIWPQPASQTLAQVRRRKLIWPDVDETIVISRWPRGRHWYLSSPEGIVFSPHKFNTLKVAKDHASRISRNVKVKE